MSMGFDWINEINDDLTLSVTHNELYIIPLNNDGIIYEKISKTNFISIDGNVSIIVTPVIENEKEMFYIDGKPLVKFTLYHSEY